MKLLLSGTTGFIGKHLATKLIAEGHTVFGIVRASTDTSDIAVTPYVFNDSVTDLIRFMEAEKFDGVIHLASLFLAQHTSEDVPGLITSNVLFGSCLLEATTKTNTPWFINTGTFWQHFEDKEYSPVNLYAATKQAFEDITRYYSETTATTISTIQLSDTFGPNDTRSKIFNLWIKNSQGGAPLEMSPGEQQLDISYIENVIDAYTALVTLLSGKDRAQYNGTVYAVSSMQPRSLRKLAALFESTTKKPLTIEWGKKDYRPREVMKTWSKGVAVPGWKPKIALEDGIKKTFHD